MDGQWLSRRASERRSAAGLTSSTFWLIRLVEQLKQHHLLWKWWAFNGWQRDVSSMPSISKPYPFLFETNDLAKSNIQNTFSSSFICHSTCTLGHWAYFSSHEIFGRIRPEKKKKDSTTENLNWALTKKNTHVLKNLCKEKEIEILQIYPGWNLEVIFWQSVTHFPWVTTYRERSIARE